MAKEIKCPGIKIYSFLEKLTIDGLRELQSTDKYQGVKDVERDLRERFPYDSDDNIKMISKAAIAEYIQNRTIFLAFKSYGNSNGNSLYNISKVLGEHVENCIGKGSCNDNYMSWLENKSRAFMTKNDLAEENLPIVMRSIDLESLDIISWERSIKTI